MKAYSLGKILDTGTFRIICRDFEINEFPPFLMESVGSWSNLKSEFPDLGIGNGAAGCISGHLLIWKDFVENANEDEIALVLESDAVITRYGAKHLRNIVSTFSKSQRNVLHLGSHETLTKYCTPKSILSTAPSALLIDIAAQTVLKFISPVFRENYFYFSTHAYLISYRFASFLLKFEPSLIMPIDVYLQSLSQAKNNKIDSTLQALFRQKNLVPSLVKQLGR